MTEDELEAALLAYFTLTGKFSDTILVPTQIGWVPARDAKHTRFMAIYENGIGYRMFTVWGDSYGG